MAGRLILIPTPIGNLEDLSPRAGAALSGVDLLACEDTRRTRTLFEALKLPRPREITAYHEHNEREMAGRLVARMEAGANVGLVSDAGMPLVSDPGFRLVRLAVERGITVEALPGPSAVTAALAASGLPPSSFTFKGFAPKKPGARRRWLEEERGSAHTLVMFEAAQRLGALLKDAVELLGDREAALCGELSKRHERIFRGKLSVLAAKRDPEKDRGEWTLVIAGFTESDAAP